MKMAFKGVFRKFREMKDDSKNKSWRRADRKCMHGRGRSHIAPESSPSPSASLVQESRWANLPPELLLDIIQRLEASQTLWPARRDVVACGAVCRLWRETVKEVVRTPEQCGLLTFPISVKQVDPQHPFPVSPFPNPVLLLVIVICFFILNFLFVCFLHTESMFFFYVWITCTFEYQPGPRDSPIQCFIKRERETSMYLLYLGLTPGK